MLSKAAGFALEFVGADSRPGKLNRQRVAIDCDDPKTDPKLGLDMGLNIGYNGWRNLRGVSREAADWSPHRI